MSNCFSTTIVCKNSATLVYLECDRWACKDCNRKLRKKWTAHLEMWLRDKKEIWRLEIPVNSNDWIKLTARMRYRGGEYVKMRHDDCQAIYSTDQHVAWCEVGGWRASTGTTTSHRR